MLSIKETKNGGIAYVFEKEFKELAMNVYPLIAAKVLGVNLSIDAPIDTEKEKTLDNIKKEVERSKRVSKVETFEKFPVVSLRKHFNTVMWKITDIRGNKAFSQRDLNEIYNRLLREGGGFDPRLIGRQYLVTDDEETMYNQTYINTCFNKGFGPLVTKIAEDLLEELGGKVA